MSLLTPGRNLVLIGLMGAGKSTVGRIVAQRLQRSFVDTDVEIERKTGRSITQMFAAEGERGFRAREAERIRHHAALRGQVIAVGGGAVLEPGNVTHLRATGDLVLLDADPAELAARCASPGAGGRPLLQGAEDPVARLEDLRRQRKAAYRAAAAHTVDTTGLSPEEVADVVLAWAARVPGLLNRDELPR